jgi:predicted transcriptional regulator of viral defense system
MHGLGSEPACRDGLVKSNAQSSSPCYFEHVNRTTLSTEQTAPLGLPDHWLARGEHWVTIAMITDALGVSDAAARQIAGRWKERALAFSPTRGAYVLIPPQFRTWGAVPASHFIDDMMGFLGHPYYVGFLSAAEVHDAAHQRPQVFQVVTNAHLRDRDFGRVRVRFIRSAVVADRPTVVRNTPTGTMTVSTPEVTVLDMISSPQHSGGLSNVATVIAQLLEDRKLDPTALAVVAAGYPAPVAQRAGWLIEFAAHESGQDIDLTELRSVAAVRSRPVPLSTGAEVGGERDPRWNVVVNADVEPDL